MDIRKYTSTKIKEYRKQRGLTQKELGDLVGVKHNTISGYENGTNEPEQDILFKIASALHISINELFPETKSSFQINKNFISNNGINFSKRVGVQIPILGSVIAGTTISAIEDILGYEEITPELASTGTFFCLKVKGNSMEPRLFEDDIIVVKQQPDIESGDVAVVLVNGDEATVKQIKKADNGITLIGYNVAVYPPTFYSNEDIINLPVTIIGKVIELRRPF